jgi:hypothetical protein
LDIKFIYECALIFGCHIQHFRDEVTVSRMIASEKIQNLMHCKHFGPVPLDIPTSPPRKHPSAEVKISALQPEYLRQCIEVKQLYVMACTLRERIKAAYAERNAHRVPKSRHYQEGSQISNLSIKREGCVSQTPQIVTLRERVISEPPSAGISQLFMTAPM